MPLVLNLACINYKFKANEALVAATLNSASALKRSKEVVCELAKTDSDGSGGLSLENKNQVKSLFLVGGFSFNSQKRSDEESRRAELKLEFWQLGDDKKRLEESTVDLSGKDFGVCPS